MKHPYLNTYQKPVFHNKQSEKEKAPKEKVHFTFIDKDPIDHDLAMTQSLNPYQYAYSNPINLHDPNGRGIFDIFGITLFGAAPATSTLNISGLVLPKNLNLSTLVNTSSTSTQTMSQTQYNSAQPAAIPTPKPTNSPTPTSTTSTSGSSGSGSSGNGTVYTSLPGASIGPGAPGGNSSGTSSQSLKGSDASSVLNTCGLVIINTKKDPYNILLRGYNNLQASDGVIYQGDTIIDGRTCRITPGMVCKGDLIGLTGSTVGAAGKSTGPHLHITIKENGIAINPNSYLNNNSKDLQNPLAYVHVTQKFGKTDFSQNDDTHECYYAGIWPNCWQHDGYDLSANTGTPAFAMMSGIVKESWGAMGNEVHIYTTFNNLNVEFVYGHLDKYKEGVVCSSQTCQ